MKSFAGRFGWMFQAVRDVNPLYGEIGGGVGLMGLAFFFLTISWRKWPDPLIDFGHELYVPWRLSQGAVLYRDVDDVYGPLSQYFNAGLFHFFGPGLMVLVTANILVFFGIATSLYFLFRQAWGAGGAQAALAVFISVFGFSQFFGIGNYNYAAPYAHETTHGLWVCLLLVAALVRWVEKETPGRSFGIGILFGLTLVLKPEIALAAGLAVGVAGLIKWRLQTPPGPRALALMGGGAILPTLGFAVYFSRFMSWREAADAAGRGWLNVVACTRYTGDSLQWSFLGLDRPWVHFREEAAATLSACFLIALIAAAGKQAERMAGGWRHSLGLGLFAGGLSWISFHEIVWLEAGRALPGLLLLYLLACLIRLWKGNRKDQDFRALPVRLLLAAVAMALLLRMVLNARIYHYGYYQAAVAAIMVPAILMGELSQRIGVTRKGARAVAIGTLALLAPGVMVLCGKSETLLSLKTFSVGTGGDRFYAFLPRIEPTGAIIDALAQTLREKPCDQTLLVVPEGVMINYLARLPNPIAPLFYFGTATAEGGEDRIVRELDEHPPDWVVIVSRDLREYGVSRYGEQLDKGRQLLQWIGMHYEVESTIGGDPLDDRQRGAVILRLKSKAE